MTTRQLLLTPLLSALLLLTLLSSCETSGNKMKENADYTVVEGNTMGTYYRVTYKDVQDENLKTVFDSALQALNMQVSTYIPESTISRFNQADSLYQLGTDPNTGNNTGYNNDHFIANYKKAREVFSKTDGFFDPTVMPLVNYWGFGYDEKKKITTVDSSKIDSLMRYIGMDHVELELYDESEVLVKSNPGVKLDFSAIAKGYGVDLLGRILAARGISNYLVDIGGETLAQGMSPRGDAWKLGINYPNEEAGVQDIQTTVPLKDRALATSGNYRNFYEVDGVKYSHTINPKTGYPERNALLSASVFAPDCMTADAYATACMTLGPERAYDLIESIPNLEAYFIIGEEDGGMAVRYTPGLQSLFKTEQ